MVYIKLQDCGKPVAYIAARINRGVWFGCDWALWALLYGAVPSYNTGLLTTSVCVHVSSTPSALPHSLHFNGHFPGAPGLASTRMYPFWILLELRVMEMVATTGAIRRANLQSNVTANKPTPSFLKAGCPSCRPTNSVKALKGNQSTEGKTISKPIKNLIKTQPIILTLLTFRFLSGCVSINF